MLYDLDMIISLIHVFNKKWQNLKNMSHRKYIYLLIQRNKIYAINYVIHYFLLMLFANIS